MATVSSHLSGQVSVRANYRYEYCQTPQVITAQTFHIDHIIPLSKGGDLSLNNLCCACPNCNLRRNNRIIGIDPQSGENVSLFNLWQSLWQTHFEWGDYYLTIVGRTSIGRATVNSLKLNDGSFTIARELWVVLKLIP